MRSKKLSNVAEPFKWIENGNFETGELAPWKTEHSSEVARVVEENGNWVLYLAPAMRGVFQPFPQPTPFGKDVTVKFRARNLRSSPSILAVYLAIGTSFSASVRVDVTPVWAPYEVVIPMTANVAHSLYFSSPLGIEGVPTHIDDVEVWIIER